MSNINLFAELGDEQAQVPGHNNGHSGNKDDDLIVFGYSCKLFRDDFFGKATDRGQSLIPWNGDENVMIDRCAKQARFSLTFSCSHSVQRKNKGSTEDTCLSFFFSLSFTQLETRKYRRCLFPILGKGNFI